MKISDKISLYCRVKNIKIQEFAASVGESKQNFSNMMKGKARFTENVLKNIRKNYTDIDLNNLLDDDIDEMPIKEDIAKYGDDFFRKKLSKDINKAIKLLEAYK
jgi:transcriptional regulator with XRE-family HTH domain